MEQTLSLKKIDEMRKNLLDNLRLIEQNKHLIKSHDRMKLMNHHNYALQTLDNMVSIRKVEMSNPYYQGMAPMTKGSQSYRIKPHTNRTIVYNKDGSTTFVNNNQINTTGEEWETQFDQSQLINPPCYVMPAQSLTNISKIRQAGEEQRLGRL